jgi:hypothetical protein
MICILHPNPVPDPDAEPKVEPDPVPHPDPELDSDAEPEVEPDPDEEPIGIRCPNNLNNFSAKFFLEILCVEICSFFVP